VRDLFVKSKEGAPLGPLRRARGHSGARPLLAALAVLVLAGCGGGDPEATSTPSAPSLAPSSAAPSDASPAPTPSSAAPRSPSATPTPSPTPRVSASAENGTYGTELSVSEDGALSYLPLRWYSGPNAEARCAEKDVKAEGAWCTDYYYEKDGARKAAALTENTQVRLLDDDSKPADASLTDLVQAIEDDNWPNYQLAVSGGRVTRITQVFTP
jgi:hypothetical protein